MDGVLCDELIEEVLRRLPPRSTSDVSLVSKRWLRLYRSTRSTLRLSFDNSTSPSSLSSFLSHFPHLSSLYLIIAEANTNANADADASPSSDHLYLSVASSFPRLTRLYLKRSPVSLSTLLSLSTSCPSLTTLYIVLSRPFSLHWLLSFHALKSLGVHFTSVPVQSRVDAASRVKSFDYAELKLETLVLSGIRRGDRGLDWLWRSCKRLRKLKLLCCEGIGDDASVSSFVDFRGLLSLRLERCLVPGEGLKSMMLAISNELEELVLVSCNLEPGLLIALGQKFRNLWKLDLSCNEKLGDIELKRMIESCNCLRDLKVRGCKGLTNAALIYMGSSCKQLESIDIVGCTGIEAASVDIFVFCCLRVRQIHVEGSKLSDVSRSSCGKKSNAVIPV